MLNRSQLPQHRPRFLALGVGNFGGRVLAKTRQWMERHPGTPLPALLWAGPEGWMEQVEGVEVSAPSPYPPALVWLDQFGSNSTDVIRKLLPPRPARNPAGAAVQEAPGIVCVIDLMEPFGREAVQPVLRLLRVAAHPLGRLSITLILGINTAVLPQLVKTELRALRETLDALAQTMRDEPADNQSASIDWCYLVDRVDALSRPLQPMHGFSESQKPAGEKLAGAEIVQVHQAAGFILALQAGLMDCEPYQRTRRGAVQAEQRLDAGHPWVGSFAVGRLWFPGEGQGPAAIDRLAEKVLREGIIPRESPMDLPRAVQRRREWWDSCGLERARLEEGLARGGSSQRLVFALRPPDLRQVKAADLLAYLQYWENLLERRWQESGSLKESVIDQSRQLSQAARSWLDDYLKQCLYRRPGGVREAELFLLQAGLALEQAQRDSTLLPGPRRWGLAWFQQKLYAAAMKSLALPMAVDGEQTRAALAETIAYRQQYRALLLGGTGQQPRRAGYAALGMILATGGIVSVLVLMGLPLLVAPLVVAALLGSRGRDGLRAFGMILRNELRLHFSLEQVVTAVRRRYEQRIQQLMENAVQQVYLDMLSTIKSWQDEAVARQMLLDRAANWLRDNRGPNNVSDCLIETVVPSVDANKEKTLLPQQGKAWAEQFLQLDEPSWHTAADAYSPDTMKQMITALRAFCGEVLTQSTHPTGIDLRLERTLPRTSQFEKGVNSPLRQWANVLLKQLCPALPLSDEERARQVVVRSQAGPQFVMRTLAFVGAPEPAFSTIAKQLRGGEEDLSFFVSQDTDVLTGIVITMGLDLEHLKTLEILMNPG